MHNPESVLDNETHKILRGFEIQTDHLIPARRPHLVIVNNSTEKPIGDTYCNWCARNNPQMLGKGIGRLRNQRTSGDHPDNSIIKIGQNTEKSPGGLMRLVVT